jgi:O-antigen/teichoic acid export membrane protein
MIDEPPELSTQHSALSTPRTDVAQRAGRGVYWNAVFLPLKLGLGFVASVVVIRLLNINSYPVYLAVTALLSTLGIVSDFGVERALPRYIPEVEIRAGRAGLGRFLRRVAWIKALTLLPFVAVLVLFPDAFLRALPLQTGGERAPAQPVDPSGALAPDAGPFLLGLIGVMLVLGAISDGSIQVLYAYFRQKITNTLDVINAVIIPALRIAFVVAAGTFAVAGARVIGLLLALLVGTLIAVILSVTMMFRALNQEQARRLPAATSDQLAHLPPPATFWQRFLAYSAMMYVFNFSVYLYSQNFVIVMVPLILGMDTPSALTIAGLGVAYNLVQRVLAAISTPMTGVQTPLFSRLHAENRQEALRTSYVLLSKLLILGMVPAGVGIIVLARNVLILAFLQVSGNANVNTGNLGEITLAVAILTLGLFGESIISTAMLVLLVFERYRDVLTARLATLIIVPLLFLLVPGWGVVGAATAMAVAGFSSRLVALILAERRLGLRFPLAFLGRVGLASVVMGAVVLPLALLMPAVPLRQDWPALLGWAGVNGGLALLGAGVFYAGFRLLGGLDAADKARFATLRVPLVGRVLRWL